MANGTPRKRRPAQRGVQAVFTPDSDWKGKAQYTAGLVALGTGAALWIRAILALKGSSGGVVQLDTTSSSLVLFSLAILLVTLGVGSCTYFLAVRKTRLTDQRIESAVYKLEALVGSKDGVSDLGSTIEPDENQADGPALPRWTSKALAIALVEGVMLILLYGGIVAEYKSNIHMQEWVRANIILGVYFLNDDALLLLGSILVGVLLMLFQLRPKRSTAKTGREE